MAVEESAIELWDPLRDYSQKGERIDGF